MYTLFLFTKVSSLIKDSEINFRNIKLISIVKTTDQRTKYMEKWNKKV